MQKPAREQGRNFQRKITKPVYELIALSCVLISPLLMCGLPQLTTDGMQDVLP
jgi:hypothetical protein